ncbi:unnamed protein product [Toxocara canis]|uniref:NPH3 domain-containing protein n=1 Tax=Toxocara canis TaxID=6265 RepID=A0A183V730_TOXCA|nr:unnamed protein product [Toxocara canis]
MTVLMHLAYKHNGSQLPFRSTIVKLIESMLPLHLRALFSVERLRSVVLSLRNRVKRSRNASRFLTSDKENLEVFEETR